MSLVLVVEPGAIVKLRTSEKNYIVKAWIDGESVILEDVSTGFSKVENVSNLISPTQFSKKRKDLTAYSKKQMDLAKERYKAIKPLIGARSRKAVEARAIELDVSPATLYRWLKTFTETGVISSLLRDQRSDSGEKRLTHAQEEIIKEGISYYLSDERPSVVAAYDELGSLCRAAKVPVPHISTFRARIEDLDEQYRLSKRRGKKAADDKHGSHPGKYAGGGYPYAVLQIDHKRLDTMVVDDDYRLPLDRPWLTVAIDVESRMVAGYYLSLEAPSSTSVSMCMASVILPKESVMALYDLDASWPCYGLPNTVHVDNAKEFRGKALEAGAEEYAIDIIFRKVKRPHYGGHIESLLGKTFTEGLSHIPGRTFSSPEERGDYDPDVKSVISMEALDRYLVDFISCSYHQRPHSSLNEMPPIKKYLLGIIGGEDDLAPGRVSVPVDRERLIIDFLPIENKPVHKAGIVLDYIWYYDDVLSRWVNTTDPNNKKKSRKFIIRRDPRDISYIWFFDPDLEEYFKVPYRNMTSPPMTLWEYKATRKWMVDQGIKHVDERQIFESYDRRKALIREEVKKTKKARRELQREKQIEKKLPSHYPEKEIKERETDKPIAQEEQNRPRNNGDVFDEIEFY